LGDFVGISEIEQKDIRSLNNYDYDGITDAHNLVEPLAVDLFSIHESALRVTPPENFQSQ
jgi:hypothetical protein